MWGSHRWFVIAPDGLLSLLYTSLRSTGQLVQFPGFRLYLNVRALLNKMSTPQDSTPADNAATQDAIPRIIDENTDMSTLTDQEIMRLMEGMDHNEDVMSKVGLSILVLFKSLHAGGGHAGGGKRNRADTSAINQSTYTINGN